MTQSDVVELDFEKDSWISPHPCQMRDAKEGSIFAVVSSDPIAIFLQAEQA